VIYQDTRAKNRRVGLLLALLVFFCVGAAIVFLIAR
jgi:hypothetical protein